MGLKRGAGVKGVQIAGILGDQPAVLVLNRTVIRSPVSETTSLGAAYVGGPDSRLLPGRRRAKSEVGSWRHLGRRVSRKRNGKMCTSGDKSRDPIF